MVWNNYLSNVCAEMLANVSVLKDFLLFGDKPELSSDLFNMDDITCLLLVYAPVYFLNRFVIGFYFGFYFVCMCVLFLVPCVIQ